MKLRYRWVCTWSVRSSQDIEVCGAKSTNVYETPDKARKVARNHKCRIHGGPGIEVIDLYQGRADIRR